MSVVDFVTSSAGNPGSTTLTLPGGAPSIGDVLILSCGSSSGSDASDPASGQGGVTTWEPWISTVRRSSQIWFGVVDDTPSASVIFNNQFRNSQRTLARVQGLNLASLLHGTPLAANNQNSNPTAGAFTPTAGADVLLFSAIASQVATVVDPSSPWVNLATTGIGPCAYRIVTGASGNYQAAWDTTNGFATWDAQLLAFNLATGAPTDPDFLFSRRRDARLRR